jgi:hypothetical protein
MRSFLPLPRRLALMMLLAAVWNGLVEPGSVGMVKLWAGWKVPSPLPSRMETCWGEGVPLEVPEAETTAMSSLPSPLKSSMTADWAAEPAVG